MVQQLLSAWAQRGSRKEFASQATLIGFSVLGRWESLFSPPWTLRRTLADVEQGFLLQLAAAVAMGLLLVPEPGGERPWSPRAGEVVPLVLASVMVEFAFRWITPDAGNIALAVVVAYLAVTGGRLRSRLHRWGYWWLCRITATLLALTLFDRLVGSAGAQLSAAKLSTPPRCWLRCWPSRWPWCWCLSGLGVLRVARPWMRVWFWRFSSLGARCCGRYRRGAGGIGHPGRHGAVVSCCRAVAARSTGLRWFAPASFVVLVGLSAVTSP